MKRLTHWVVFTEHLAAKQTCVKEHILEFANVIIELPHQIFEIRKQFRHFDLSGLAQIIHWLEEPMAESAFPDPISDYPGEAGILGRSEPSRIRLFTSQLICLWWNFRSSGRCAMENAVIPSFPSCA